jgi:hypothetical protein
MSSRPYCCYLIHEVSASIATTPLSILPAESRDHSRPPTTPSTTRTTIYCSLRVGAAPSWAVAQMPLWASSFCADRSSMTLVIVISTPVKNAANMYVDVIQPVGIR